MEHISILGIGPRFQKQYVSYKIKSSPNQGSLCDTDRKLRLVGSNLHPRAQKNGEKVQRVCFACLLHVAMQLATLHPTNLNKKLENL